MAPSTGPSRSGNVTARNESEKNSSHQTLDTALRNTGAAAFVASPVKSCNEFQFLPVTQSSLNTTTAPPENIQQERFEDMDRDRNKLGSAQSDFK